MQAVQYACCYLILVVQTIIKLFHTHIQLIPEFVE